MDDSPQKILELLAGENPHDKRNGILTEDSTLPTTLPDGPDDHQARGVYGNQIKRVLTELSASKQSFYAKGHVDVVFTGEDDDGNPEQYIASIPIRSIPEHIIESISRDYQAIAAEMPYRLNPTTGDHEADREHPQFMDVAKRLAAAQRDLMYEKMLHGLNMPIKDEQGVIVWGPSTKGTRDKEEARRIITDVMGITSGQITKIVEGIDALTTGLTAQEDESLEKK